MLILESVCENSSTLRAIYFINNIIEILFIAVPAALVLVLSIDIAKNVLSKDENEIKETLSKGIKRIIYAALLFFVPLVVKVSFNFLGNMGVKYLDCFNMATKENIAAYEMKEEIESEAKRADRQQELEQLREKKELEIANRKEESARLREQNKSSNSSAPSGNSVTSGMSGSQAIAITAKNLAWPIGTSKSVYSKRPTDQYKAVNDKYVMPVLPKSQRKYDYAKGRSCCIYVMAVVRASGYDTSYKYCVKKVKKYMASSSKWKKVDRKNAVAGDIFTYTNGGHIYIYGGSTKISGKTKYIWYQADVGDYYGYAKYGSSPASKTNSEAWHATGTVK